ncbi:MAG TPA: MFS transporter [Chloroflexota bacterium]|nr:MFS transporter [Chloroflexota bacterium]
MRALYALWALLFVCLGLCIAVLGPSIPAFRDEFGVSLAGAGVLFTVHSCGYLGGVLVAGPLADRRGRRLVAAIGAVGLLVGTALAALAPGWGWFLGAMVPSGIGFAFTDVALNAAIGDAVTDARRRAAAMNLLHGAFPLGTLVAPAALAVAWQLGATWRHAFVAIAGVIALALPALLVGRPRWPAHAPHEADSGGLGVLRLLREPRLVRLAALQGLYVGVELGIPGWLATYLIDGFGASVGVGAIATSAYWGGFLAGRPAVAWLTHRYEPGRVVFRLLILAVAAAAAGVIAPGPTWAAAAYVVAGVAICGVFPTVMAVALHDRPRDSGAVAALITAAASLGGLTWPWLVGAVADGAGVRAAMATAGAPLLAMIALARSMDSAGVAQDADTL